MMENRQISKLLTQGSRRSCAKEQTDKSQITDRRTMHAYKHSNTDVHTYIYIYTCIHTYIRAYMRANFSE
jgi:hypothetical protein